MKEQGFSIDIWTERDSFHFIQPTFCRWIQDGRKAGGGEEAHRSVR